MVDRTVIGLIAEGYEFEGGDASWLSDGVISIGGTVLTAIDAKQAGYLALDIASRSKMLVLAKTSGQSSGSRRIGAGIITESGNFVGIGRAYPYTRALTWEILQRNIGILSILQTSINIAPSATSEQWSKFFIDGESYACSGPNNSEILFGVHDLGDVGFLPGAIAENEDFPAATNPLSLWQYNVHADRYIYIYDIAIPDGYTAWVRNSVGTRVGVGAVFVDGVAIIDLLDPTLVLAPQSWITIGIYNDITLIDSSATVRVYGGDVFGVAPIPNPPNTPTITVDNITTLAARLNSSIFVSPDENIHVATQWQVQLIGGDWSSLVIDTGLDPVNLLTYIATLDPNTYYEARVRYEDDTGLLSEWSNSTIFVTLSEIPEITSCDLIIPTNTPDSAPEVLPIVLGEGCGEPVFPTIPEDELEGVIVTFKPCP